MRVYMAGKFETREALRPIRDRLWNLGHEVVSTWLDEAKRPSGMDEATFNRKLAIKDMTEIKSTDLLILDTHVPSERGGKEVEYGFALGQFQTKQVWIVGPRRNVFHWVADQQFDEWDGVIEALRDTTPVGQAEAILLDG